MGKLVSAKWRRSSRVDEGVDLHVLDNFDGPDLREWLRITNDADEEYHLTDPNPDPDIDVVFEPLIRYTLTGNLAHGFGIEADTETGEIRFDLTNATRTPARTPPTDPTLRLYNFLVVALVSGPHPTDPAPAQRNIRLPIRVHLHTSLVRVWATPSVFSVPQDIDELQEVTILAEFDEDVIGDISYWNTVERRFTNWRALNPQAADPARPDETSPFPDATVTRLGFELSNNPAVGTEFFVAADLSDGLVTHVISVRVRVTDPLATPRQVTRLETSGPPTSLAHLSQVRNILFLPEGFVPTQRTAFERYAQKIVAKLRTEQVTIPFNTMREGVIFWSAWVASNNPGTTTRRELRLKSSGDSGIPMTLADAPTKLDKPWKLRELLYEFGLPVPSETGLDKDVMITRWLDRYTPMARTEDVETPVQDRGQLESLVTQRNFKKWRRYGKRAFINHVDSHFHFSHGETSTVAPSNSSYRSLSLNKKQTDTASIRQFIHHLQTTNGVPLGHGWTDPAHKDFGLVVFLVNTDDGGGSNSKHFMTTGIRDTWLALEKVPGRNEYELKPGAIPTKPSLDVHSTVVHELAHSFHLDDEYGEGMTAAFKHMPSSREKDARGRANVQPLRNLGAGNNFDINRIKWNWHRIKRAAPIAGIPVKEGDPAATQVAPGDVVRVPMTVNTIIRFKKDMIVRLRQRPLSVVSMVTDRLKVKTVDNANNALLLEVEATSSGFNLTDYFLPQEPGQLAQALINQTNPGQEATPADTIIAGLAVNHGARFHDGEIVTLRRVTNNLVRRVTARFQVTVVGDTLEMQLDPMDDSFRIATWTAPHEIISLHQPPIVFQVVENKGEAAPAGYGPDLRIIAPKVWEHLSAHKAPLTRAAAGQPCTIPDDKQELQKPKSVPDGIPICTPRDRSQIVAIYDGGDGYHCGLVHPSGHSNMRNQLDENQTSIVPFDHVSRYVIVDLWDPTKHFFIDKLYEKIYPHK